ncbi:hypothetical protein BKA62DRAFT_363723 [Auriculariales sp. MPI-PUGE-AT-0066]|nr:hypothetical protein BKA62DRAFT_363723 [Auriculariales sp. MPI-PUGE-AT-0066]
MAQANRSNVPRGNRERWSPRLQIHSMVANHRKDVCRLCLWYLFLSRSPKPGVFPKTSESSKLSSSRVFWDDARSFPLAWCLAASHFVTRLVAFSSRRHPYILLPTGQPPASLVGSPRARHPANDPSRVHSLQHELIFRRQFHLQRRAIRPIVCDLPRIDGSIGATEGRARLRIRLTQRLVGAFYILWQHANGLWIAPFLGFVLRRGHSSSLPLLGSRHRISHACTTPSHR